MITKRKRCDLVTLLSYDVSKFINLCSIDLKACRKLIARTIRIIKESPFSLHSSDKADNVFLYRDMVDFRKSNDGLVTIIEDDLKRDAYTSALFLFCNKAKDTL